MELNKKKTKSRLVINNLKYDLKNNSNTLKGWKYVGFITGLVGFIAIALYPIIIDPMMNADKYKKIQSETRQDVNQELIQPGNMRIWSNPFDPRDDRKIV